MYEGLKRSVVAKLYEKDTLIQQYNNLYIYNNIYIIIFMSSVSKRSVTRTFSIGVGFYIYNN